ncbi:hypothetical protein ACFV2H_43735 [Streptomyces sp. NPDC059629]|uniref:hypothetical protein n=1 Tax=Streptomyces sp. NPDC059629 TaxID=3346889 RepID=UPI0036CF11BF
MHDRSHGTYGAPRVHAVLQRHRKDCGRLRIARRAVPGMPAWPGPFAPVTPGAVRSR